MTELEYKELDTKMAELMGWHWDNDWDCLIPPEQKAKPSEMWTEFKFDDEGIYREPIKGAMISGVSYNGDSSKVILPRYSRDIAAALLLIKDETDFSIEKAGENYHVLIVRTMSEGSGKTLPLAICRAAVMAAEAE